MITTIYGYKTFMIIIWKRPKTYHALISAPSSQGSYSSYRGKSFGLTKGMRDYDLQKLNQRANAWIDQWWEKNKKLD